MVQKWKQINTSFLQCINFQGWNVISVKLSSFFFKNERYIHLGKSSSRMIFF